MLSNTRIEQATPAERPYKVFDTGGLFIIINPVGSKWWRFKYKFEGRRKEISLGVYPFVSLETARKRRDECRTLLANGVDPSTQRKEDKQAAEVSRSNTLQVVAEEWLELKAKTLAANTISKKRWILNTYIYPKLADRPIKDITSSELLPVLKEMESLDIIDTTHRAREILGNVFRYGANTNRGCSDITANLKGTLVPVRTTSHAAIVKPALLVPLLQKIHTYQGRPTAQAAFKLLPILFPRSIELREMQWTEIDWNLSEWEIPAERMKPINGVRQKHIVPLPRQAIQILKDLRAKTGACFKYVFPNERGCDHPMTAQATTGALIRSGYPGTVQTPHGFRATAKTIMEEILGFPTSWIELQLAHEVKDPNGTAYNRTTFLDQRKEMMQYYADYLDNLRMGTIDPSFRMKVTYEMPALPALPIVAASA